MKIAISATGDQWDAAVDTRFGRAKGFFVIDTETEETSYIDNTSNLEASHGAGTSSSQMIINKGIQAVITEAVGPKAGQVLRSGNITVYTGVGTSTIKEAYEKFKNGELKKQAL